MTLACSFVFNTVFNSIKRKLLLFVKNFLLCGFGRVALTNVVDYTNIFSAVFKFVFKDVFKFRSIVPTL